MEGKMGKRGAKSLNIEEDEGVDGKIGWKSDEDDDDDDAEANEDLSLKIVDKAIQKLRDANSDGAVAIENGKDKKKEKKTKKKQKSESEVDSVSSEKYARFGNFCSDLLQVEVAKEEDKIESDKAAGGVDGGAQTTHAEVSDNIVLRKLLRGPRYFDPPNSSWGACYNCGEEGHRTANCTSARRKKPCFVCGSLEHNAKQCSKSQYCFICKKGGHRAKNCPEKSKGGTQSSRMCLKCGELGHDMFSCQNDYSPDDLKEIRCYICKSFGHLCCVDYADSGPRVISCYSCGLSGHTGLACKRSRGEISGSSSFSSCFRCGEEGHFARECTNPNPETMELTRHRTPKRKYLKENKDKGEVRSAPNEFGGKSRRKRKAKYEGQIASASKEKQRHCWVTEHPGDSFSSRFMPSGWKATSTSSYKTAARAASPYASASHSTKNPWNINYGNATSNGSGKYPQHTYFGSRYSNNSNGEIGRNLDFH